VNSRVIEDCFMLGLILYIYRERVFHCEYIVMYLHISRLQIMAKNKISTAGSLHYFKKEKP